MSRHIDAANAAQPNLEGYGLIIAPATDGKGVIAPKAFDWASAPARPLEQMTVEKFRSLYLGSFATETDTFTG